MTVLAIVLAAMILILLWLRIDYRLGRKKYTSALKPLEFPVRKSNLALFTYGQKLYDELFQEIKKAREHIHILFYIVKNDEISNEFLNLLGKKAAEGVKVRLLLDWFGSKTITKKNISALRKSGVEFAFSHKPSLPFLFYTLNIRNHRKIAVIDGKEAYMGGFNIGKEYIGQNPKLGFWRDYHLKISGPGAHDLQAQFLHDWKRATKQDLTRQPIYYPQVQEGPIIHRVVPTEGLHLQSQFESLICGAKREIIICSPYFIPGKKISECLQDAAKKGVKVSILVPMKADHPLVKEAAFPYYKPLIQAGCKIFRYHPGFYHAKVIMVDEEICDIGTANFDKRSFFLNYEINCFIYDREFISKVKQEIRKDIAGSEELTLELLEKRSLLHRGKESVSLLISHFL